MPRKRQLVGAALGVALLALPGASVSDVRSGQDEADSPAVVAATGADAEDLAPAALGEAVQAQVDRLLEIADEALTALPPASEAAAPAGAGATPAPPHGSAPRQAAQRCSTARQRCSATRRRPAATRQKPSTKRRLRLVKTITGGLTPKSIVSAQNGKVFAMNMMYNHTITVFNRRYKRAKVIDDSVDLSKFGYEGYTQRVRGAPVEAALAPDGRHMYVSNYSMYGPGFGRPGFDLCTPADHIDRGFVYEINTRTLRKTDAIQVGAVPKYLAVTPDGRTMLVGNWCSWDVSVVDLAKGRQIHRIDAGVAPRGIAFSPDSRTAYVTLVGEHRILVIDMRSLRVKRAIGRIGKRPRHLVMSPDGRYLYITVQGEDEPGRADGRIKKYDLRKRRVVASSPRLVEPRTTVLADDGKSLYVADYHPGTLVKLKASDLSHIQTAYLGYHPIGVTYDNASHKVWVSGYGGAVWVLKDK